MILAHISDPLALRKLNAVVDETGTDLVLSASSTPWDDVDEDPAVVVVGLVSSWAYNWSLASDNAAKKKELKT